MTRLQGKASNAPAILTALVILLLAFLGLEYFGIIDLVPNFGRPTGEMS